MNNLLITISYDGSSYHGWQVQKNAVTVQEVVQRAVERVFCESVDIKGCSRTDSGVHANKYCLSFKTSKDIDNEKVVLALNTYLPKDIAVLSCKRVGEDFHARYNVKSKQYIYKLYNCKI